MAWRYGPNATVDELREVMVAAIEFLKQDGRRLSLVFVAQDGLTGTCPVPSNQGQGWNPFEDFDLNDPERLSFWRRFVNEVRGQIDAVVITNRYEEGKAFLRLHCDPEPFGIDLMNRVADELLGGNQSGLYYRHREYCGHGLVFSGGQFQLVLVEDGGHSRTLASWPTKEAFVQFFAPLDDWKCSGANPDAPFYTTDGWELGNQRITRERLRRFAAGDSGAT